MIINHPQVEKKESKHNEEHIITGYPIDGAMGSSGGGRVWKLSVVCEHNNAIVARGILVTILHCGIPEPWLSAIYIVSSAGTLLTGEKRLADAHYSHRWVLRSRTAGWSADRLPPGQWPPGSRAAPYWAPCLHRPAAPASWLSLTLHL